MKIVITRDHDWTSNNLECRNRISLTLSTATISISSFYSLRHTVDMIHQIWSNNRFYRTTIHLFRNTSSIIVHHMLSSGNIQRAILGLVQICIPHHLIHSSSWNIQVLGFLLEENEKKKINEMKQCK